MIKPINSKFWKFFWRWWIPRKIKRDFNFFEYDESFEVDQTRPQLILANHFSVWDILLTHHMNNVLYKKQLQAMGQEEVVQANKILRTLGTFSIKKGTKDVSCSIQYAAEQLNDLNSLLMICPQGRIESLHASEVTFEEGGVCSILSLAKKNPEVIFQIALVEFGAHHKPSISVYLKVYNHPNDHWETLKSSFLDFFNSAKQYHAQRVLDGFPPIANSSIK